ncbi:MAG: glycosyl hydrolase 115 family protein, partial [Lentisphaeria bacterium]|nr:glycosyl hydrolase 115 family protein [Lentisphaeria bacterium]
MVKKLFLSAGCALTLAAAYVGCTNASQSSDSNAEQQGPQPNTAASYVLFSGKAGAFRLAKDGVSAKILVDPSDWPGVVRAAKDLGDDVGKVTGSASEVVTDAASAEKGSVIVGTIGRSKLIDSLIADGKIDVSKIKGQWESFQIQAVDGNLVVAGSDKRGTIFGIYDISGKIGVSPWYWWADVPARKHDALYIASGTFVQGSPKVKYRGIFINDEDPSFTNWARSRFGGVNSKMYAHMFELILRLKGNYLWPAMWGKAFNEDDPLNPVVAD